MDAISLLDPLPADSLDWLTALWTALTTALGIALLRACDVTLGVFKTTFTVGGRRALAAGFAALESGTWLIAAGITLGNLTAPRFVGFAGGVAAGTWLGMLIVHRLRFGLVTLRVFVPVGEGREAAAMFLTERIRAAGHGATSFRGSGRDGPIEMIMSVVRRREARDLVALIEEADPDAFLAIDSAPAPGSAIAGRVGTTV